MPRASGAVGPGEWNAKVAIQDIRAKEKPADVGWLCGNAAPGGVDLPAKGSETRGQFTGTAGLLFGGVAPGLKSQSSSRTMFIDLGASIPMRTEFGPIRTTVIAISSPIRIRSLVFLDRTNMTLSPCCLTYGLP